MSEVKIVGDVNVKQSRGAGTVLMFVFFGLPLMAWWLVLACLWVLWMIVAGVVSIFDHGFFGRNWYQPWPAWMFGIR
jgi:hypothetical protein